MAAWMPWRVPAVLVLLFACGGVESSRLSADFMDQDSMTDETTPLSAEESEKLNKEIEDIKQEAEPTSEEGDSGEKSGFENMGKVFDFMLKKIATLEARIDRLEKRAPGAALDEETGESQPVSDGVPPTKEDALAKHSAKVLSGVFEELHTHVVAGDDAESAQAWGWSWPTLSVQKSFQPPHVQLDGNSFSLDFGKIHLVLQFGSQRFTLLDWAPGSIKVDWPAPIKRVIETVNHVRELVSMEMSPVAKMGEALAKDGVGSGRGALIEAAAASKFPKPHEAPRLHHSSRNMHIRLSSNVLSEERVKSLGLRSMPRSPAKGSLLQSLEDPPKPEGGIEVTWSELGMNQQLQLMTQFGAVEKFTSSCLAFAPKKRSAPGGKVTQRDWQTPSLDGETTVTDFIKLEPWAVPCGNEWMAENTDKWEGYSFYYSPGDPEKCMEVSLMFAMEPVAAFVAGVSFTILPDLFGVVVKLCWVAEMCGVISQIEMGALGPSGAPIFQWFRRSMRRFKHGDKFQWTDSWATFRSIALGLTPEGENDDPWLEIDRKASLAQNSSAHTALAWKRLDVDGDEKLSLQEISRTLQDLMGKTAQAHQEAVEQGSPGVEELVQGEVTKRFEAADVDGDGFLSPGEVRVFLQDEAASDEPLFDYVTEEENTMIASQSFNEEGVSTEGEAYSGNEAAAIIKEMFREEDDVNSSTPGKLLTTVTLVDNKLTKLAVSISMRSGVVTAKVNSRLLSFDLSGDLILIHIKSLLSKIIDAIPCSGGAKTTILNSLNGPEKRIEDEYQNK